MAEQIDEQKIKHVENASNGRLQYWVGLDRKQFRMSGHRCNAQATRTI